MRPRRLAVMALLLLHPGASEGGTKNGQDICFVGILPDERDPNDPGPPDEVYGQRYTTAFEAYCWNCVAVKANRLEAECPRSCRGLSAVQLGCTAGADRADDGVDQWVRKFGREKAQKKLRTLAAAPTARQKAAEYFPKGPEEQKAEPQEEPEK